MGPDIEQPNFEKTASAQSALERKVSQLEQDNRKLRHMLFMAHGSEEHYLYGDDGERTCNTCMIDFNADTPEEIEQKMWKYNMLKISRLQAEGKWPPVANVQANPPPAVGRSG